MRTPTPGVLALLLLPFLVSAPSASGAANLFTPEQWEADIDFLVSRLEIVHPDPYANVSKEEFGQFLNGLRAKARTDADVNLYAGITELVALVRDGHTWASWGDGEIRSLIHLPPLSAFMFSDGLYITSATNRYSSIVGKRIVKVCRVTTEEFMRRRTRIKASENESGALRSIDFYIEELQYLGILGPKDNFRLTLEDGDGRRWETAIDPVPLKEYFPALVRKILPLKDGQHTTMNGDSPNPLPLWLSRLDSGGFSGDPYWLTYLPEHDALYVQINECADKEEEPFAAFYQRMFGILDQEGAKRLIIDVRNNVGGDHHEQPLLLGILERPGINRPDRLFLITSRFTFSAAQHLVSQLTRYTKVTTIGEPAGARPNFFGGQKGFYLPNSRMYVAISSKLWQDAGPNDFRVLAEPEVHVPLASSDFRNNHDPVLDRIFNYDSYGNLRPESLQRLVKAYTEDGIAGMKSVCGEIKPLYAARGLNLTSLLYGDLGAWMSANVRNDEDYVAFLRFLRQELPGSVEVCWALANQLDGPEDKEESVGLCRRCLEINPAHRPARMRLRLMELDEAARSASGGRH